MFTYVHILERKKYVNRAIRLKCYPESELIGPFFRLKFDLEEPSFTKCFFLIIPALYVEDC